MRSSIRRVPSDRVIFFIGSFLRVADHFDRVCLSFAFQWGVRLTFSFRSVFRLTLMLRSFLLRSVRMCSGSSAYRCLYIFYRYIKKRDRPLTICGVYWHDNECLWSDNRFKKYKTAQYTYVRYAANAAYAAFLMIYIFIARSPMPMTAAQFILRSILPKSYDGG